MLASPAAPFLADPLRFAVITAHLAQDEQERLQERAQEHNYLYATMRGDGKEAHAMLRRTMEAAGFIGGQRTVVTDEIIIRHDPYFGAALMPEEG
jgi:hypothetical protein